LELPMRTSFIERFPDERFLNELKFITDLGTAPKVDSRAWGST
tara:strand:- start:658 stop:786 length:129 start_codon:yes stop_codon:yes gene_type:complete